VVDQGQVTQLVVEDLFGSTNAAAQAQLTQLVAEHLYHTAQPAHLTQLTVEVLYTFLPGGPPGPTPPGGGHSCGPLPEEDEGSIAVDSETTNYSGQTLDIPYDWPFEEVREATVDRFRFDSGHVRAGLRYPLIRRVWRIHASAVKPAERTTLLNFWAAHKGTEIAFTWTPFGGSALKVHFADDSLITALRAPDVHSFSFDLEELVP
jgi:hypothetical protein